MAGIMNKFRDIFLGPEEYDDDYYDDIEESPEVSRIDEISRVNRSTGIRNTTPSTTSNTSAKVVNIHNNMQMQVDIARPKNVDEAGNICDALKDGKTVLVDLEKIDRDECQRIVDFLSGVAYALNGEIRAISIRIFIVAPSNVGITGDPKEVVMPKDGVAFPWTPSTK